MFHLYVAQLCFTGFSIDHIHPGISGISQEDRLACWIFRLCIKVNLKLQGNFHYLIHMLNSHRSLSSTIKKSDKQRDIKSQIYKYMWSPICPLKAAQPGKRKSSSKAGKKKKNLLKCSVNYFNPPKKGFVNSKHSSYMTTQSNLLSMLLSSSKERGRKGKITCALASPGYCNSGLKEEQEWFPRRGTDFGS